MSVQYRSEILVIEDQSGTLNLEANVPLAPICSIVLRIYNLEKINYKRNL